MLKPERRLASCMVADYLRRIQEVSAGRGEGKRSKRNVAAINSDPSVVRAGGVVKWCRRLLPDRKEVSVKCDCGGLTDHFTVLRDYKAAIFEQEALGPRFGAEVGNQIIASAWNVALLEGKCVKCGQLVQANVKFVFDQ